MSFKGQIISKKRKEANLTQEELGNKVGLSKQAICNIEKGFSEPSLAALERLAKALKCKIDDLFG